MNWISNVVRPKIRSFLRRETPENLWIKCPETGQLVFYKDVEANQFVIPELQLSHAHQRAGAAEVDVRRRRLRSTSRCPRCRSIRSSFATSAATPTGSRMRAPRPALQRRREARHRPARRPAGGRSRVQDFDFMGGSLGMAAGEAVISGPGDRGRKGRRRSSCSRPRAARACRRAFCR